MTIEVRIKEEDNLEQVVKETVPQIATQQILQSSAWNNKENHNKGCVNPQLAEIKNTEEEQTRARAQPTPMLQEVIQEETKKEELEEVEDKKVQEQFAATQGKSGDYLSAATPTQGMHKGANDYMGNEFFEAGCTCGAEIHVNPTEQHMATGDLVTDSNTYDKNIQPDTGQTNYGTTTSDNQGDMGSKTKSGSMMYEDKNKTGGYVPK